MEATSGAISFLSEADLQRGRRSRQQFIVEDLIIEPTENDVDLVLEDEKIFHKKSHHQVGKLIILNHLTIFGSPYILACSVYAS